MAAAQAANDARWTDRFDRITDGLVGLTSIVGELAASQQRTDKRMDDVGEYIKTVDSHLNLVIEMFEQPARRSRRWKGPAKEGHLRDDRGNPPS